MLNPKITITHVNLPNEHIPNKKIEYLPDEDRHPSLRSIETESVVYINKDYQGGVLCQPLSIIASDDSVPKYENIIYWVCASWLSNHLQYPYSESKETCCQVFL